MVTSAVREYIAAEASQQVTVPTSIRNSANMPTSEEPVNESLQLSTAPATGEGMAWLQQQDPRGGCDCAGWCGACGG